MEQTSFPRENEDKPIIDTAQGKTALLVGSFDFNGVPTFEDGETLFRDRLIIWRTMQALYFVWLVLMINSVSQSLTEGLIQNIVLERAALYF